MTFFVGRDIIALQCANITAFIHAFNASTRRDPCELLQDLYVAKIYKHWANYR